jgi:hypothetical protein
MEEWLFFDIMRKIILWSCPVIFLLGVTLLVYSNYSNFEAFLGREFGLRKRIVPKLGTNVYSFHEWCLKKHALIGLVFIIYALVVFMVLSKIPSPGEIF